MYQHYRKIPVTPLKKPSMSEIEHFMTVVNYRLKEFHLRCCTPSKSKSEKPTV